MKNKIAQKYFAQKKFSVVDFICIAVAIVAAIVATFVWGGGPIGIPLLALSLIVLVFSRSTRVKDSEIDRIVKKMFSENCGELEENKLICTFYLSKESALKGKDGKIRSPQYVVSYYETVESGTNITVFYFNLIENTLVKENFFANDGTKLFLEESTVILSSWRKKMYFLSSNEQGFSIPVSVDDIGSARILEKLCN